MSNQKSNNITIQKRSTPAEQKTHTIILHIPICWLLETSLEIELSYLVFLFVFTKAFCFQNTWKQDKISDKENDFSAVSNLS